MGEEDGGGGCWGAGRGGGNMKGRGGRLEYGVGGQVGGGNMNGGGGQVRIWLEKTINKKKQIREKKS